MLSTRARLSLATLACAPSLLLGSAALAAPQADCSLLPSHAQLTEALRANIFPTNGVVNGGLELHMWATLVNRDGQVCAVAKSGEDRGDQWPGSRVISAQKASTANAFSLPGLALSTANLYAPTQPGGSLFGLQFSNPVDTAVAYGNSNHKGGGAQHYGDAGDPMVGEFIGGVNVFGGGTALYDETHGLIGALGVSGDTSCADHNIAWRVRDALDLDSVPAGVGDPGDNITLDPTAGFGHPLCGPNNVADNAAVIVAHPLD